MSDDAFGEYLQQIGKIPRLSHYEEVRLTKIVHEAVQAHPEKLPTSNRKEDDLPLYIQSLPPEAVAALNRICEANLRLVVRIAKKYSTMETIGDFSNEGAIGLQYAVLRFDPTKGFRLSTYIFNWIRQACQRAVWVADTITVPCHSKTKLRQYKRILRDHLAATGERLSNEAIAEMMDMPVEKLNELIYQTQPTRSLDQLITEDQTLLDRIASVDPEYQSEAAKQWGQIREYLLGQTPASEREATEFDLTIYEEHHSNGLTHRALAEKHGIEVTMVRSRLYVTTRRLKGVAERLENIDQFRRDQYLKKSRRTA